MSEIPQTLSQPALESVDTDVRTMAAIVNPAIALIDWRKELHLLLARSTAAQEGAVMLQAVRLIRIPVDGRLTFIRWLSHVMPMYFPDEILFDAVVLLQKRKNLHVPMVVPDGPQLASSVGTPFPLKQLTEAQYQRFATEPGRALLADVLEIFAVDLAGLAPQILAHLHGPGPGATPWPA